MTSFMSLKLISTVAVVTGTTARIIATVTNCGKKKIVKLNWAAKHESPIWLYYS